MINIILIIFILYVLLQTHTHVTETIPYNISLQRHFVIKGRVEKNSIQFYLNGLRQMEGRDYTLVYLRNKETHLHFTDEVNDILTKADTIVISYNKYLI